MIGIQIGVWTPVGCRPPHKPKSVRSGVLSSPRHNRKIIDVKACKKAREIQRIYRTTQNVSPFPPKQRSRTKKKASRRIRRGRRLRLKQKRKRTQKNKVKHKILKKKDPAVPETNSDSLPRAGASDQGFTVLPSVGTVEDQTFDAQTEERSEQRCPTSTRAKLGRKALADHQFTDSFIQLQSAIKIQGLYRCMCARRKVEVVKYITRLKGDKVATDSAVAIQRSARGKIARFTLRKLHLKAILIQRVFRRYFARTRLLNAAKVCSLDDQFSA